MSTDFITHEALGLTPLKRDPDVGQSKREHWAQRIGSEWRNATESVLLVCQDLVLAKEELSADDFETMVTVDLGWTINMANKLMVIGRAHDRLCAHVHILPPSWGTLHVLASCHPPSSRST